MAENCRFDRGGVVPLNTDLFLDTSGTSERIVSMFAYYPSSTRYFFVWPTDVDTVQGPVPNDSYKRVFYTEDQVLKVTDKDIFSGIVIQTDLYYPTGWRYPSPPPPVGVINAVAEPEPGATDSGNLAVNDADCDADSTYLTNVKGNAIDGNTGTYWQATNTALLPDKDHWWQYDFGTSSVIINYLSLTYGKSIGGRGPGDFTILGSDSGTFTGEEITLYQASGITWGDDIKEQVFKWINSTAYRFIRIKITRCYPYSPANNQVRIIELELHEITQPTDPTLLESRGYVYTFVNGYGDEGPPFVPDVLNLVDVFDGHVVNLSNMDTVTNSVIIQDTLYNITNKRIYRINQSVTGDALFQFLDEIGVDAGTDVYKDTIVDSSLGEVLPSLEWDPAPTGIKGIISLANGVLAGFVDNLVCFSVPFHPHAWPVSYQKAVDRPIVGLGAFGTTVIVLTEGQPYLIVGNDPANTVMEKMDMALSCISKRGIVHIGNVVIYPSPEGLIGISSAGIELLTSDLFTKDQWLTKYVPSTISAYYWEGKYVGFYVED